jgi:hypothetical protein
MLQETGQVSVPIQSDLWSSHPPLPLEAHAALSLRLEAHGFLSKWRIPLLIRSRYLRIRPGYCENADEHVRKSSHPSD